MRPSRSTLVSLIILLIISAVSVGYLFYTPRDLNYNNRITEYKLKALRGDAQSQWDLGFNYILMGDKIPEGVEWIKKASDQGNTFAQCFMAKTYIEGDYTEIDPDKGFELYRKAAVKGFNPAQTGLGNCYLFGKGVEVNPAEALKWYQLAAHQGYDQAMLNIGLMHFHGAGIEKDIAEAFKWIHQAAINGNSSSQVFLGKLLVSGDGCEKDDVEAYAWLKIAAECDDEGADELKSLRKQITAEQIGLAMKRISELKPIIQAHRDKHSDSLASNEEPSATVTIK